MQLRAPTASDGRHLYQLVHDTGVLEPNSAYTYVMMADLFSDTCAIAELGRTPIACLIGFRPPRTPQALFVWQIGVSAAARGHGVALALLDEVLARPQNRDIHELQATVSPDNTASEHMFRAFARRRGASFERIGSYAPELFPCAHEAEHLYRIAPL